RHPGADPDTDADTDADWIAKFRSGREAHRQAGQAEAGAEGRPGARARGEHREDRQAPALADGQRFGEVDLIRAEGDGEGTSGRGRARIDRYAAVARPGGHVAGVGLGRGVWRVPRQ